MRTIAYHFASGGAFFSGLLLLIAATAVIIRVQNSRLRLLARIIAVVGVIFVVLSATPRSWWFYSISGSLFLVWLVVGIPRAAQAATRRHTMLGTAVILSSLVGIGLEIPFHLPPNPGGQSFSKFYLIGDSISAGMLGPEENTWPKQFQKKYQVEVVDLSQEGETAKSALKKTAAVTDDEALILLEIGGNDILGSTNVAEFEANLNQLLSQLTGERRTLLMMELPLPPFYNRFGQIQRRLAHRYGVRLIPKRYFIDVLGGTDATLDGLHLSERGHGVMAATVWSLLQGSLNSLPGEPQTPLSSD